MKEKGIRREGRKADEEVTNEEGEYEKSRKQERVKWREGKGEGGSE